MENNQWKSLSASIEPKRIARPLQTRENFYNFELHDGDVALFAFPRVGRGSLLRHQIRQILADELLDAALLAFGESAAQLLDQQLVHLAIALEYLERGRLPQRQFRQQVVLVVLKHHRRACSGAQR